MDAPDFGFRLFGYSISEVNGELLRADYEHFESLKDLELKIGKYLNENQKLKDEIDALKKKRDGALLQTRFLEAAVKNAEQFIKLYEAHTEVEISRLKEKEQRLLRLYEDKLAAIEEEIRSAQKALENALDFIMRGNAENMPQAVFSSDAATAKPAVSAGAESEEKEAINESPDTRDGANEGADKGIIQFELVRAVKFRTEEPSSEISKETAVNESPAAEVMTPAAAFAGRNPGAVPSTDFWGPIPKIDYINYDTSDDTEDYPLSFADDTHNAYGAGEALPIIAEPLPLIGLSYDGADNCALHKAEESAAAVGDAESSEGSAFSDLIPLLETYPQLKETALSGDVSGLGPVKPAALPDAPLEPDFAPDQIAPEIRESVIAPAISDALLEAPVSEKPVPADSENNSDSHMKAAPDDKLSLAAKYIVGKIAGEDLYDGAGRLIAAKGVVITEDIVREADKAGKLSELIINMTISDLPEISA